MGTPVYLILILIGGGLLIWGLLEVRSGLREFQQQRRRIEEQAEELRSEIAEMKRKITQATERSDSSG